MTEPEEARGEMPEDATVQPPQDTYRKVLFGPVADPLFPPHPEPEEMAEDELARVALEDPAQHLDLPASRPGYGRLMALLGFSILALGAVFWWRC